ncbi:unnamed protein product, partial [Oikopleura dioica]
MIILFIFSCCNALSQIKQKSIIVYEQTNSGIQASKASL